MAPFIDGGRTDRSHELVEHGDLVLPVRRRDRAGARSDAARSHRRPRLARRLHARDVARRYGKPGGAAKATSIIRTRSPTPRRRWPRSAAIAAFARDFFARYIQGHEVADYARLLARAGFVVRKRNRRPRVARRSAARVARRLRASPRWWRRPGRSTPPGSTRTTSCSRSTGSGSPATATSRRCCAAQARRHGPGRVRRSHRRREDGAA